ncbi:MAG: TonB-dependent receptor [Opitutaceae bacterium]|nr:TonB-dependent receptor [Opitutaceae bacterium]
MHSNLLTPISALMRRSFRTALTGIAFLTTAFTLLAADSTKRNFDLAGGPASETLKTFARQAGREIVFSAEAIGRIETKPVQGEMAPSDAIDRMLADTGLVATQDAKTGAFAVRRGSGPNATRAAQTDSGRPGSNVKVEEGVVKMAQFEVFDSKLINTDIPRTRDDAQPYVVFNREQLQSSPAFNLEDFFRTRLPMNQRVFSNTLSGLGTESNIDLRGLGTNQTLILLDGRRLPPRASGAAVVIQADINGIPLGMIERIEILPSTASGIYGGGATGGVINIITRKDYSGVELAATYQNTFDTDAASRRIDLNGSFSLEQGRTMLTFNYSRTDANLLLTQDRDFLERSRALQWKNNPAAFTTSILPPAGYLTNIRSSNGANLVLKNGTALNSPITHVPAGYAGPASDGGAALVANAGRYDLNLPQTKSGTKAKLLQPPSTEALGFSVRRRFGTRVEAYVDASRLKNNSSGAQFTNPPTATIAANAPNNPFTSAISVSFPDFSPTTPYAAVSQSDRLAAGAMVRLPADWTVGADYIYSRSRAGTNFAFALLGDPDGTGPGISYTTALSNGTLNVLRDLNMAPLDLAPYLMPNPYNNSLYELTGEEWTLRGSGPLVKLPAGPLALSTSAQSRDERIGASIQTVASTTNPNPSYTWHPPASVKSLAYYAELNAPIFSKDNQIPLVQGLELQASVRRDDFKMRARGDRTTITVPSPDGPFPTLSMFDRKFQATKATVGLKYTMTADLTLRASLGTGFLPPTLIQLSPGTSINTAASVTDPRRGNVPQVIAPLTLTGGDPSIEPEESESTSAGLVFTPRFLPGFRLSVDYTRIEKTNEIALLPSRQVLLDLEDKFPELIERAPLTPQDQALGYTGGVITVMNLRNLNLAGKLVEAWDVQVDYTWKPQGWGEIQAFALATWQPHLQSKFYAGAPWLETVGYSSTLKFRGNGGLTWTKGAWTLGWNAQYYNSYILYNSAASEATRAATILNQGSATIPSQTYHDISASYRWGKNPKGWQRLLADSQLTLGVQNLFNTSPPIIANTGPLGFSSYSNIGDPRLRRYTISLRKKF